jgi:hypothetical protein
MKKRLIALLLLAVLLLPAVACDSGQTPADTSPDTSAPEATAEPTAPSETDPATDPETDPATDPETTAPETTAPETEPETEPPLGTTELDKSKTYKILFVGNSYTYFNNMPAQYFGEIMKAAGYKVKVISVTKGGWTLSNSANPGDELGSRVDSMLTNQGFDFVVLQEQSMTPAVNTGAFYNAVGRLDKKIRECGATPILYATWGRRKGSGDLTDYGLTDETMTWKLAAAYEHMGQTHDIPVAHVGLAFWDVLQNQKGITLHDPDLSHPSPEGSYLAALTIFARITGIDPTTVDYEGGVGSNIEPILKEAARKAVFETPEIPEEYMAEAARRR